MAEQVVCVFLVWISLANSTLLSTEFIEYSTWNKIKSNEHFNGNAILFYF